MARSDISRFHKQIQGIVTEARGGEKDTRAGPNQTKSRSLTSAGVRTTTVSIDPCGETARQSGRHALPCAAMAGLAMLWPSVPLSALAAAAQCGPFGDPPVRSELYPGPQWQFSRLLTQSPYVP